MKVCYFGDYKGRTSRSEILIQGLRSQGVDVVECTASGKYLDRSRQLVKLFNQNKPYDLIFLGAMAYFDVILARFLAWKHNIPLFYDLYLSLYETEIMERKHAGDFSLISLWSNFLDYTGCILPDVPVVDTEIHKHFYAKRYKVNPKKFGVVPFGADTKHFTVCSHTAKRKYIVHYHGSYLHMHGLEYVIQAAKLLKDEKDIVFHLYGGGQYKKDIVSLAKKLKTTNVKFFDKIAFEKLPAVVCKSSVFLAGPFEESSQAINVIPNKLFEGLAQKVPMLIGDTPANRELLSKREALFVPLRDAEKIAESILFVKNNPKKVTTIVELGHKKFLKEAAPEVLGKKLKRIFKDYKS